MLTEDEDEDIDIQYTDTGIVEGNTLDMSNTTHISSENEKFPFDGEKRCQQFVQAYGKTGKHQPTITAYAQAITHLGRAPTHYPPITAAQFIEQKAVDSRIHDMRLKIEKRLNPETWLTDRQYMTDWKEALETQLNYQKEIHDGNHSTKRGNTALDAASAYTSQFPPV